MVWPVNTSLPLLTQAGGWKVSKGPAMGEVFS